MLCVGELSDHIIIYIEIKQIESSQVFGTQYLS